MTDKTKISFVDIQDTLNSFYSEMENFAPEKYEGLKKRITSIQDDIQLILLESQERYEARLERRPERNKEIKEYNKLGPRRAMEEFVRKDPAAFFTRLEKKGVHFDNEGAMHSGSKLKKGHKILGAIPVDFTPKQILDDAANATNYEHAKNNLETRGEKLIGRLYTTLEEVYAKSKNIFEGYATPEELFDKLGLKVQKVDYSFFAKEDPKDKKPSGAKKHYTIGPDVHVDVCKAPTFKKIGCLMKYVLDNEIPFRASNIIEDNTQRYQFYFYDRDITILMSDVIVGTMFRDATFVIKGMVPGLKYISKEELKKYQGRKIMFSDTWDKRIEGVFTDNPENRPTIGEEKEEADVENKTAVTDRTQFIGIMKANFSAETLNVASYEKFAQQYNADPQNTLLLKDTIYGNAALLGLGGRKTLQSMRGAIFQGERAKLQIPENSFFSNEFTRAQLHAIRQCEGFDKERTVGSEAHDARVLELIRKAFGAAFVDEIKNKSAKEKKTKLKEYTGVESIPLFATTISTMLGGRVRCMSAEYHKLLRERFDLHTSNQTHLPQYKQLQIEILQFETNREDQSMKPHAKKEDRKVRKNVGEHTILSDASDQKSKEEHPTGKVEKKKRERILIVDKGEKIAPIGMEDFPMHKVKSATIVAEKDLYRLLKAYNCDIPLKLYKKSVGHEVSLALGKKIEIFAIKKRVEDNIIIVNHQRYEGCHKVAEFRAAHEDNLIDEYISGEKYEAIVNNIQGKFAFVSLTKNLSGRLTINPAKPRKVGDRIIVTFDALDTDSFSKPIVKIH
ncbi:MAG: hypothetical protein NTX91_01155 [candidate division SR1 bacterium]|nr:hypothetical protein [candidate division SR1 bacterium]